MEVSEEFIEIRINLLTKCGGGVMAVVKQQMRSCASLQMSWANVDELKIFLITIFISPYFYINKNKVN